MKCESIKLKDLLQYKGYIRGPFGSALKRGELQKTGIPVYEQQHAIIGTRNFRFFVDSQKYEELKRFTVRTDDIIISCSGTIGKASIIKKNDPKGIISQALLILRCDAKKILPEYLYYFLTSSRGFHAITSVSSGSVQVNIAKREVIENIDIPYFILDIQKRIVSILKNIDDKIELNNKINNNLLEQVLTLYLNRFVDTVNDERRICRADEYFDISIGKTPPRKEPQWFSTNPQDVTWVSISDMGTCGLYISSSSEQLTREAVDRHNVKVVPDNTVLLSFKLTVGRIAITNGEMTTNEAIAHFKTDKKEINEYLYCYLKCFNYQTMGSTSSIATAVNSKIIKGMPFVVPTDDELKEFHDLAAPMFAKIKANQIETDNLSALRDTLLPKLMSGELDVSDIDL